MGLQTSLENGGVIPDQCRPKSVVSKQIERYDSPVNTCKSPTPTNKSENTLLPPKESYTTSKPRPAQLKTPISTRVAKLISVYQQESPLPPTPPDTPTTPVKPKYKKFTHNIAPKTPSSQAAGLAENDPRGEHDASSSPRPTTETKSRTPSPVAPKSPQSRQTITDATPKSSAREIAPPSDISKPAGGAAIPETPADPASVTPSVAGSAKSAPAALKPPASLSTPKPTKLSLAKEQSPESPTSTSTSCSFRTAKSSPLSQEIFPDPPTPPVAVIPFRIPSLREKLRERAKSASSQQTEASPGRTSTASFSPSTDNGLFISSSRQSSSSLASSSFSGAPAPQLDPSICFFSSSSCQIEPPPWDRSVEVTWKRRITTRQDKVLYDDELCFQENVARLREERIVKDPVHASMPNSHRRRSHTGDGKEGERNGDSPCDGYPRIPSNSRQPQVRKRCLYFLLPDSVRFKITKHVLSEHFSIDPDHQRAVRLNSASYLEPIWPVHNPKSGQKFWTAEYFDSLQSVLAPLCRYMSACYNMRVDFLSALFLTRRFHVVFSPFVTERTQPAATLFLDRYGPLMKWITLEVDYSKLGGHWNLSALWMDQGISLTRVADLVERFAERQATRYEGVNIQSFALLVRRYYGFRVGVTRKRVLRPDEKGENVNERGDTVDVKGKGKAVDTSPVDSSSKEEVIEEPIPYTDDKHLDILHPLKKLGTHVDSFLVVGANKNLANDLIYAFWGKEIPRGPGWKNTINRHRNYRVAVAYPYTPGQLSMIDRGPKQGGVQIAWHVRDPRQWVGMNGCTLRKNVNVVEQNRNDPTGTKVLPPSYGVVFKPPAICGAGVSGSGAGNPGAVVKVNKFVTRLDHPVVSTPPEQPRKFGSAILGKRSFMRSRSEEIHHQPSVPAVEAMPSCSGTTGPTPLNRSSLARDDLSMESGGPSGDVDKSGRDEGLRKKKSSLWRAGKIPVLIRKHARSLRKSKSDVVEVETEAKKDGFGGLVKKASKSVLKKRIFRGGCLG